MRTIDLEGAVAEFLALGQRLQAAGPVTGERVLGEMATWYRECRVQGARVDEDGDMLLLEWGATLPLVAAEPTDLRGLGDDDLNFAPAPLRYLRFTRQVMSTGGDDGEAEEFDDAAVQMAVTLAFEPADGSERGANQWIPSPADLDAGTAVYLAVPFVQSLRGTPAGTVSVTVGHAG